MSNPSQDYAVGEQPLHALLEELGLKNGDLVSHSVEQLSYKQVNKARHGRRVSANIQAKIKKALEAALRAQGIERSFDHDELFNYSQTART